MKLDNVLNKCLAVLDNELNETQIRSDFWSYFKESAHVLTIEATTEYGEKIEIEISSQDEFTVLSKSIKYGHRQLTFVPLVIEIGIGTCRIECGIYKVSKCSAELLYNNDMELVDIDFYIRSINKL
jgi:hypothetical protein